MTRELQSTHEAATIEWLALRNHIPCMASIIQLALGAFMSSLGVRGLTKSWEAHEHNQQFGENESMDIGKSQRLWKKGNTRSNKVSAMRPGLATRVDNVRISRNFGCPETNLHIAKNACCINYADTWMSKWVHWLAKSQGLLHDTKYDGCGDTLEFDVGVGEACRPIKSIHLGVAPKSNIQWTPPALPYTGWMDRCQVHYGGFEAIVILDPMEVKQACGHIASRYHSLQWNVESYGWRYASFSEEEEVMEGRLVLRLEVSATDAVEILCWCYSNDGYASEISSYPQSVPEVAII